MMTDRRLRCLRCDGEMERVCTQDIQLGKARIVFGSWPNVLAGALRVDIWCCQDCGKLEFYANGGSCQDTPQVTCPVCGRTHDFDYPRCPYCGHPYDGGAR